MALRLFLSRKYSSDKSGFMLLEAIICILVISICFVILFMATSSSSKSLYKIKNPPPHISAYDALFVPSFSNPNVVVQNTEVSLENLIDVLKMEGIEKRTINIGSSQRFFHYGGVK